MSEDDARPLYRSSDPVTSRMAAIRILKKISRTQIEVWQYFKRAGHKGMTDLAMEKMAKSHRSTLRSRRNELTIAGVIVDSGNRTVEDGETRIIWRLSNPDAEAPPEKIARIQFKAHVAQPVEASASNPE